MKRFTKLYTWLIITVFYFNTTMPSAYCGSNDNSGSLHISKSLASISKTYTPSSSNNHKFIIHIKDIHCNYKVQKNISLILKQLITDRTTSLVTLEGASGIIDTDIFSIIPDKNVKQSVCDQFIKKGVLTGAESLSIIEGSGLPFTLWGPEDTNLYIKNFKTFRDIKFSYKNIRLTLTKVKKLITLIKTNSYPHNLYDFDIKCQNVENIQNQTKLLNQYAKRYSISTKNYTNFYNFCTLLKADKNPIDYSRLKNEKSDLLKQLKNNLTPTDYKKVSSINIKYSLGSVSPYEYFDALTGLINKNNKNYPVITDFLNREKLKISIRHNLLETDLKNLEKDIKNKIISEISDSLNNNLLNLFEQIDETSQLLRLYGHLFNLQLTDDELSLLDKTDLSLTKITTNLSNYALKLKITGAIKYIPTDTELKNIELAVSHCKFFYKLANERSKTMVANLLKKMDYENKNTAVLIAGGFHTNAIEKELEKNKIKYITLTPHTTKINSEKYINLMLDEKINLTALQNLPLAQYISFPVLCSMLVQKSGYFHSLRQELAVGLLTYGKYSIAQYRKQLKNQFSEKMFDRLIALSGIDIDNEYDTTVETLISDISPDKIAEHILTYDNKKLDMEIRATNPHYYDSMTSRKILASYLFAILETAVKVNSSNNGEIPLLNYIIENSSSPDKSIIKSVAEERLKSLAQSPESPLKQRPEHQNENMDLKNFAFEITRELAKAGLIDISDSLTVNDIKIGKTNLTGLTIGGIEDRISFEILIPTTDGSKKIFHAKSARYGDFEQLGAKAFEALGINNVKYFHSNLQYKDYFGFHITEHVGDMDLSEIDPASENIADLAYLLGNTLANAHLLGLIDRNLTNLRVILKNGKPNKIVNIDFTNALSQSNIPISYQAEAILALLKKTAEYGADKQQIENIALKFMAGFANSLVALQTYYANNKEAIDNNELLAESPRWQNTLKRLNPQLYDITPVVIDFMKIINDELGLNIRLKSPQTQETGTIQFKQITQFIRSEKFSRFYPKDNSIDAKLFINKKKNVFLKTAPNFSERIKQRLPMWRHHPRTIITNAVSLILMRLFSYSPVYIALHKIGDIVPPIFVFGSKEKIKITKWDEISSGYFQKKMRYTLKEAFKILAKQDETDRINALIEKYFQLQLTMIKRGVLDRDSLLMQNYGIDDINSLDIKCFDFGATTSFLPLALYAAGAMYKFNDSLNQLSDIVPAQCVKYYKKRYKEVFNVKSILKLWKTEKGVSAEKLSFDLNSPIEFTVSTDITDINIHESFYNFIENENFTSFSPSDSSANADLFRSQDGKYYIKTESSYIKKIKNRIIEWKKNPLSFFTNAIGNILTVISSIPPNFIARRVMGDCVPAMLEFDYKRPLYITKSRAISKGYVQQGLKYSLVKVFAILTKKGDIRQINMLIDRFFEIQTTMLSRGVFDEDIFFSQNYGVNDIYSTDIKWFDFGRSYPFLFLPLKACVTKGKFNNYINELSKIIPPECIKHYTKRYKEVFNIKNVLKIWNTKEGVHAQTISKFPIGEDNFPDYLGGSYNTKGFVKTFLESINMADHQKLEKSLVDILEKAKNSGFNLTIDDLVDDKVSYLQLITTMASTKAELNQKLVRFSLAAATSINKYKTSPALMVAIQKTVFDYITNMSTEKEYKMQKRFQWLIESSL